MPQGLANKVQLFAYNNTKNAVLQLSLSVLDKLPQQSK